MSRISLAFRSMDIKNTYIVLPYIKISNEVGRIDNFADKARKLSVLPTSLDIFLYTSTLYKYSIYLSVSDLLSVMIFNTDKHEFR